MVWGMLPSQTLYLGSGRSVHPNASTRGPAHIGGAKGGDAEPLGFGGLPRQSREKGVKPLVPEEEDPLRGIRVPKTAWPEGGGRCSTTSCWTAGSASPS